MSNDLLTEINEGILTLTINREASSNALNGAVLRGILESLQTAKFDKKIKVLCFRGAGKKAFCAGADLLGVSMKEALVEQKIYATILKELNNFPIPLVALVSGVAMGGGLGLCLSCDLIYASDNAIFASPEINVGLFPLMISPLIYKNIPRKKATEMILTGKKLSADEALKLGIVSNVFDELSFDQETLKILKDLTSKSSNVLKFGKEAIANSELLEFNAKIDYLCDSLSKLVQTPDAQEGIRAFIEKRRPDFKND